MKFTLQNSEWKQVISALLQMPANFSINILNDILKLFKIESLTDETFSAIEEGETEADFPTDLTGWGKIVEALGEQKAKDVFNLLQKLLQNTTPQAEETLKKLGGGA